ncbi:hypothetical protein M011DRAFT_469110 [Sporormia fimetaria CBS 119925]|uniref:Uncharacterized protein n=1 Tax=Sporormia fimetaria CBS 119925 TaxID=1340428 RepID=A0A6A6V850_9PLEO|nr:hypothetical protein M011DRAFT_469110 [Sporormia fimetaria CBS 119925]
MDTVPGGEGKPYEADDSDVRPHAKLAGQFGGVSILATDHTTLASFYSLFPFSSSELKISFIHLSRSREP